MSHWQESDLPLKGDLQVGSISFLKGAARVQSAMAAVVAMDKMNMEARLKHFLKTLRLHFNMSGSTRAEVLPSEDQVQAHSLEGPAV